MHVRLSADTDLIRAYGAAAAAHAEDLHAAATRLAGVGEGSDVVFGPAGARFLAALAAAAGRQARDIAGLTAAVAAGRHAAGHTARDYEDADAGAGARLTEAW